MTPTKFDEIVKNKANENVQARIRQLDFGKTNLIWTQKQF